jgi:hypothetical protein
MKGCTCKPGKCNCKPKPGYPKNIDEAANPAQQAAIAISKKKEQGVAEEKRTSGTFDGTVLLKRGTVLNHRGQTGDLILYNHNGTNRMYNDPAEHDIELMVTDPYNGRIVKVVYSGPDEQKGIELFNQYNRGKNEEVEMDEGENWSKHNNKRVGGMSKKSVSSYRRSHPGSKIQTAVTTKPSKIKKGSKDSKRRASFCARMRGMKKHNTSAKTAHDPDSNINKSLRRWHCESVAQLEQLVMLAEQKIRNLKK